MGSAATDTLRSKRLEAYEAFYKLRHRLNSWFDINDGADPFGKTVGELNGLSDVYNSLIARRTGSGEPVEDEIPVPVV